MNTPNHVQTLIQKRKKELRYEIEKRGRGGFSQLCRELDVSKGMLWKFVYKNYIPTSAILLHKLGLPEPIVIYRTRDPKGQFE